MRVRTATRGFSLTELLVVVAVILILISVLIVGVEHIYASAMCLKCQHRLEQIGQACYMYASANDGRWPAAWDFAGGRAWYDTLAQLHFGGSTAIGCPSADIDPTGGVTGEQPGVPPETRDALAKSLNWFKSNLEQLADGQGCWGQNTEDAGGPTALSLMAFLGYGCTTTSPPEYADTVRRALKYLVARQYPSPAYNGTHQQYHRALVPMALCDAYAMMGDVKFQCGGQQRSLRDAAQKSIDSLLTCATAPYGQDPVNGGFGYWHNSYKPNDASVSFWAYQAVRSALMADISVPAANVARAETYLEYCMHDSVSPATPYRYSLPPEEGGAGCDLGHHSTTVRRMTAASLLIRLMFGHAPTATDVTAQLNWLKTTGNHLAVAQATGSSYQTGYDLYFTYYMTLALYYLGGAGWTDWMEVYMPGVLNMQNADGSYNEALVPYGSQGRKMYPTALACIGMEACVGQYLGGSKWCKAGNHSYGYNKLVGEDDHTPAADTIVVMDYMRWGIDAEDPAEYVAPRHSGKVNALLGDGHVRTLAPEEIADGMWTPQAGD